MKNIMVTQHQIIIQVRSCSRNEKIKSTQIEYFPTIWLLLFHHRIRIGFYQWGPRSKPDELCEWTEPMGKIEYVMKITGIISCELELMRFEGTIIFESFGITMLLVRYFHLLIISVAPHLRNAFQSPRKPLFILHNS